ncbi:hypothetical protein SUGI_0435700 [Cryptomeria japonica]|nr:hypothetical protein SUGI_0435700 [Cryptomeria japonica]
MLAALRDRGVRAENRVNLRLLKAESDGNLLLTDLSKEIEEDTDVWEELAIICIIIGPKYGRRRIKEWVEEHWKSNAIIKFIPKGFFIAIFMETEEKEKIMHQGNWFVDNYPLYMQPWFLTLIQFL